MLVLAFIFSALAISKNGKHFLIETEDDVEVHYKQSCNVFTLVANSVKILRYFMI